MENFELEGLLVDVHQSRIYPARVVVKNNHIFSVTEIAADLNGPYLMPGLIDAHVHIESSMLIPTEFARMAVVYGTVCTVSDPHEIANVLGIEGVRYMVENGRKSPFKFHFGAPSCVPATSFETAGATIDAQGIKELLSSPDIGYLAEMMNFPGVLHGDPEVLAKIEAAHLAGKPVDGHAPGLMGDEAAAYAAAGISTDHECFTLAEALDKIKAGMKIIIREGSAARNFEALWPLLNSHPQHVMWCSDDKHPNDLELGHINQLLARAVAKGIDPVTAIKAATVNPALHYKLPVGLLREGDPADFIQVENLTEFKVKASWINGTKVAENGKSLLSGAPAEEPNNFDCSPLESSGLTIPIKGSKVRCIEVEDGQLMTGTKLFDHGQHNTLSSDVSNDVLKLVVMNRYSRGIKPALAMVHKFGLKKGALASTVAHDSHNIIAVGADDKSLLRAINLLVESKGGISLVNGDEELVLPLPVAGLMSTDDGWKVAAAYDKMDKKSRSLGSPLSSPYMTLSFLALLVIPHLKLSDKGLFDGTHFQFTDLFTE